MQTTRYRQNWEILTSWRVQVHIQPLQGIALRFAQRTLVAAAILAPVIDFVLLSGRPRSLLVMRLFVSHCEKTLKVFLPFRFGVYAPGEYRGELDIIEIA